SVRRIRFFHVLGSPIELTKICPGTETSLHFAMNDDRVKLGLEVLQCSGKRFQLLEGQRADFVARAAIQREFEHSVVNLIRHGFAAFCHFSGTHAVFTAWYMSSISLFMRAEMKSRFSFPLAVSIPLSIENGSFRTQNARTCL